MYYEEKIKDHIRVPPDHFHLPKEEAILQRIKKDYEGYISKDLGIVIDVSGVEQINEGVIIAGDGAAYYETTFTLMVFKPEMQEVVLGKIKDITDFGAFLQLGAIDGMIHVSQTMDDFVSFSKEKTLLGKDSKRVLRVGDVCRARVIATSYKDVNNPKIGLTMRQPGLGRMEWITEEEQPQAAPVEKKKKETKK